MGYDARVKVKGIRPPDEKWKKMKAVWDACEAADLDMPEDVEEFFGPDGPSPEGIEVEVEKEVVNNGDRYMAVGVRNGAGGNYYLIDLKKLPKNITHLKVWLSESY